MKKFMGRTMAKMNENRRNGRKALKGFTLVEIIVVLVILAILAAAMIPALTGYIDKAKERTAIAEARNVLTAAQTLASEEYGLHGETNLLSKASADKKAFYDAFGTKILALADINTGTNSSAAISGITFDGTKKAKIKTLDYKTAGGVDVFYDGSEFYVGEEYTAAKAKASGSGSGSGSGSAGGEANPGD